MACNGITSAGRTTAGAGAVGERVGGSAAFLGVFSAVELCDSVLDGSAGAGVGRCCVAGNANDNAFRGGGVAVFFSSGVLVATGVMTPLATALHKDRVHVLSKHGLPCETAWPLPSPHAPSK